MGDCRKNGCKVLEMNAWALAALVFTGVAGYIAIIVIALVQLYNAIAGAGA